MRNTTQPAGGDSRISTGVLGATLNSREAGIDPVTLAQTDLVLFRSLRKIGTPRERICSALFLSYAEYDDILWYLEGSE